MEDLKNCLSSIDEKSTYRNYEVIVVENNSTDPAVFLYYEELESAGVDKGIKVIRWPGKGFNWSAINNYAVCEAASGDYLLFLNNDTEVKKGSIRAMIDLISSHEDVFSVQAKMLQYKNKDLIDDAGDEYNLLAWTKKIGENHRSDEYNDVCDIFSACAGAAMYKKSLLGEIGAFDSEFFAYMEDVDLAIRSRINGYRNLLCPDAVVYHIGSATSGSRYNEFKVRLAARNNVWVVYKNLPVPLKIVNFVFLFLGFFIKYVFFVKKGFGSTYLSGIREGLSTRDKIDKVKFQRKNTKNYFKIEYKLIINTFKFLKR